MRTDCRGRLEPCNGLKGVVLGAALLLLAACSQPEIRYADGEGGEFADWAGNWVFVNYWAEWCAPCREEIPELNEFHAADNGAMVIGVNYDGIRDQALVDLMRKMDIAFPVLNDCPAAALNYTRPDRLPTTFVFNPEGDLVSTLVGPQSEDDLAEVAGLL
jgi:thiol-disulfide isomerase/thioredoxin